MGVFVEMIQKEVISLLFDRSFATYLRDGLVSSVLPSTPPLHDHRLSCLTCAFSHWIKSCARTTNRPALCSTNSHGNGGSKSSVSIRCMAGRRTGSKGISLF